MGFAFWFDPSTIGGNYGDWARDLVLRTRLLQRSEEVCRVRIGDLLYYNLPQDKIPRQEIAARLERSNAYPGLVRAPLDQSLWKHRIYTIFCEGLSEATAKDLHRQLLDEHRYMGCYGANPVVGLHRWLFEFALILRYRIAGDECWTNCDDELAELEQLGCFQRVRHVPVFDSDFADADAWQEYCRTTSADRLADQTLTASTHAGSH